MSFNDSQTRAIAFTDGPAIVLAGAGSGKTTVITHRILSLIQKHHVNPGNILVITFTKAAANEMKERFLELSDHSVNGVTFGTFHAVFFMVLKIAYHFNADNIISEDKKFGLIKELIHRYRLEARDENDLAVSLLSEISMVKNSRIDLKNFYSGSCSEEVFRKIFSDYEEALNRNRLIDFDDMMTYTLELFEKRKDILAKWQEKYKYILIDEFQDINQIQFDIVKLLALPENNLFIVGDDDQSIYRFRGSKPEIMLNFKNSYPDATEILLDTNYRCNKRIVDRAMHLIAHNKRRFDKKVFAAREETDCLKCLTFDSSEEENRFILDQIQEGVKKGDKLSDYAVLFRTNTNPRQLMEFLMRSNVTFTAKDRMPNLYDHWAVKDIRTYIRIAYGSRERADFLQIMNKPLRYFSRDTLTESQVAFEEWEKYYEEKPWMLDRLWQFEKDLKLISKMSPYAAVNYIRKGVGYDDYIRQYCEEKEIPKEDLEEVLDELLESTKGYRTIAEWNDHIAEYEEELKELAKKGKEPVDAVTFSTLHSAKGLEFDKVFIIDVNEGTIPYKKAVLEEDLEEERRLFYVGMTRAKDALFLCSVKNRYDKETAVSRFITEISD